MNALTRSNGSRLTKNQTKLSTVDKLIDNFLNEFKNSYNTVMDQSIYTKNLIEDDDGTMTWAFNATAMKKEWMDIDLNGNVLTIQGETPEAKKIQNELYYQFRLPNYINTDTVSATLEGGILYISAEKQENETVEPNNKIEIK